MEIKNLSIKEMKENLEKGLLTSEELVVYYLDRIAKIDQGDTKYNSVFEVNPDAIHIARQRDYERANNSENGIMHGIPVLLKDNINTGDKTHTTAGARILKNHYALKDAKLVETLREQGAIILGKTNLTEFACFKTFEGVNGYSSLGGQVLCPWDINADPSGSSTGSAVAVSLRLAPVAVGTETLGSIMSPSQRNGVVGIKPTIGLISREGIIPISNTTDTAGPMGTSVSDVAYLLSALRCFDETDPITLAKERKLVHYTNYLTTDNIKGKKVGIVRNRYDVIGEDEKKHFEKTIDIFKKLGIETIELEVDEPKNVLPVLYNEFKATLNNYLNKENLRITLKDIIKFNQTFPKDNLKYGQQVFIDVDNKTSGRMNEPQYIDSIKERSFFIKYINEVFDSNHIDLIYFSSFTSIGAFCGFPTLTLPIGINKDNLPIGTFFLAKHNQEDKLIHIAYNVEKELSLKFDPLK